MSNNTAQLAEEIQQAQAAAKADDEKALYEGETAIALREAVKNLGLHWVLKELALIQVEAELTPSRRATQYPPIVTHRPVPHTSRVETLINGFSIG